MEVQKIAGTKYFRNEKSKTIVRKIIVPMLILMIFQSALSFSAVLFGGTIDRLNQNSIDILNERVINRTNYIENEMIRASNLEEAISLIKNTVRETVAENDITEHELTEDNTVTTKIIDSISQNMIYVLRKQASTGVFVVFNGGDPLYGSVLDKKAGLYLRDSNPNTVSERNSDITVVRGAPEITKKLGLALDIDWKPDFELYTNSKEDNYYYNPLRTMRTGVYFNYRDVGYWSRPFSFGESGVEVITYTVPLVSDEGVTYGVLGIEMSVEHLKRILPYDELADNKVGTYVLAIKSGKDGLESIMNNGPMLEKMFKQDEIDYLNMAHIESNDYQVIDEERDLYGCVQNLKLYNTNTPFVEDQWALVGILSGDTLFSFSKNVEIGLLMSGILSLLCGIIAVIITAKLITNPIEQLAISLKNSNPTSVIRLKKTYIKEVDELAQAVENLGNSVVESSNKITKIIQMASIKLGAFERRTDTKQVFITQPFFEIFGEKEPETKNGYISEGLFNELMGQFSQYVESSEKDNIVIYKIPMENDFRWVRIKRVIDKNGSFGIAEDITQEILEKKKIEYDRDHDILTGLLNRRAFHSKLEDLFKIPQRLGMGAMIMIDLDNLKHINDTFGHEGGDQYLKCVADVLKVSVDDRSVISRISGDEFYIFIYGYKSDDALNETVCNIRDKMDSTYLKLSDNSSYKIRASMGMTYYPKDAQSYESLMHYADFAMYTAKNTAKGELKYFDIAQYNKNAYLLQNKEELNRLIDNKLISYHLQPIVDANTGEIFAYEALMRSNLQTLKSPFEILTLARSQFKLYQIERLTWFGALEKLAGCEGIAEDCKLFINSIPNQMLSYNDMLEIEELYKPYLSRLVIEMTEEEKQDDSFIITKQSYARTWNASIALDDFGSGYNGDIMLLYLAPEYVKVDMTIVRDIDKDKNRLKILQNLISYTKERKIKVIAEGVETYEEMRTLIESGVDYLQGYYLGMPEPQPQEIKKEIIEELEELRHMTTNT